MTITREEADTMIIQQVASVDAANILTVAETICIWAPKVTLCKTMTSLGCHYYFPNKGKDRD